MASEGSEWVFSLREKVHCCNFIYSIMFSLLPIGDLECVSYRGTRFDVVYLWHQRVESGFLFKGKVHCYNVIFSIMFSLLPSVP